MTNATTTAPRSAEVFDLARFDESFAEFLARIRPGAAQREADRTLLFDEVRELKQLGFGALLLPTSVGGGGLGLEQFFDRFIELAAADSNLAHLFRGHIAFVDGLLLEGVGTSRELSPEHTAWVERIVRGDLIGNAQSERQETATITTRVHREGDTVLLTGTKYYTTGSIYADWIHLSALEGDERVAVTVSSAHDGVRSVDDWDGFGQLLTGSGTTTFERVPVDPGDIVPSGPDSVLRWHFIGSLFQLILLGVVAGVAESALRDTVEFVRPRRRTFGFDGETSPRDDALVQGVVGELSSVAVTARKLVLSSARDLDRALAGVQQGDIIGDGLQPLLLDVYRLQQVIPPLVLGALNNLFEVGGASAVSRSFALDRHWRNVRTIASHNPAAQRGKAIGQFELNGTLPDWKAPGAGPVSTKGEER